MRCLQACTSRKKERKEKKMFASMYIYMPVVAVCTAGFIPCHFVTLQHLARGLCTKPHGTCSSILLLQRVIASAHSAWCQLHNEIVLLHRSCLQKHSGWHTVVQKKTQHWRLLDCMQPREHEIAPLLGFCQ